ncbi:YbaY family lipoprotein [Methyloprofundus sp.]|uniref:YbaY family lipoprotein n=1 Tax=Methyloprofundus sp. TaxID=2020875 RepID=UPI003D0C9F14
MGLLLSVSVNTLYAEPATLTGSAYYRERIALPGNAVFEAVLEDVSLMDIAAVVLGSDSTTPAGQPPFAFAIKYDSTEIKPGHRYNVRAKITVDGKLKFISDTMHPVLKGENQSELLVKMVMVKSIQGK